MGYKFVASTSALLIFSFLVLSPAFGNAGTYLFDMNVSESELQVVPEIPTGSPNRVSLTETFDQSNVTFKDSENVSNADYNTSYKVVTLEDNKSSGYVVYKISSVRHVETKGTKYNVFNVLPSMTMETLDDGFNTIETYYLAGSGSNNVKETTNYLKFNLEEQDDVLYEVRTSDVKETGVFGKAWAYLVGLVTFPITLWELFTQFPNEVQYFYGFMLTWLIVDILQIG